MIINLGNKVQYTIRHNSRSKHVSIRVEAGGHVVVTAPHWLSRKEVDRIVESRRDWIAQTISVYGNYAARRVHTYTSGDEFYLYGVPRILETVPSSVKYVEVQDDSLELGIPENIYASEPSRLTNYSRNLLQHWYRQESKTYLSARLAQLSAEHPRLSGPSECRIRKMMKRWGSCSKDGHLTFSSSLICAPGHIIDSVILHEMCHRLEFNHRASFYTLLESVLPEYSDIREEMKKSSGLWTI